MTWGFVGSFGGVVLVFVVLLIAEKFLLRRAQPAGHQTATGQADVVTTLASAEAGLKEVEVEIARARRSLARGA